MRNSKERAEKILEEKSFPDWCGSSLERGRWVWWRRGGPLWGNTQECLVNSPVAFMHVCQRCLQGVDTHTLTDGLCRSQQKWKSNIHQNIHQGMHVTHILLQYCGTILSKEKQKKKNPKQTSYILHKFSNKKHIFMCLYYVQ